MYTAIVFDYSFLLLDLVGIEHEAYNVSEGDGLLELCAILVRGIPTEPAKITLTTVDGRAAGMPHLSL